MPFEIGNKPFYEKMNQTMGCKGIMLSNLLLWKLRYMK